MEEKIYWLWLYMILGGSNHKLWDIVNLFKSPSELHHRIYECNEEIPELKRYMSKFNSYTVENAEKLLLYCERNNIGVVCYGSEDYPFKLYNIYNPPPVLFYKGNIKCLSSKKMISIVGTREPSDYCLRFAKKICDGLCERNVVLVSGFAIGIDICANISAISYNMPSVCVVACGLDIDYPKGNSSYRQNIIDSGGVFISEYPPGARAYKDNFIKRNRILAGLGDATVVFQATTKSGSLITAKYACEQGKEVYSMPPADVLGDSYGGNISLLKDGALFFFDADDIINYTYIYDNDDIHCRKQIYNNEIAEKKELKKESNKNPLKDNNTEYEKIPEKNNKSESFDNLNENQKKILDVLSDKTLHIDELIELTGIDTLYILTELIELEVMRIVDELPGKMFKIIK